MHLGKQALLLLFSSQNEDPFTMSYHYARSKSNQYTSRRTSSIGERENSLDLYSILQIVNPDCGYVTCVGFAPTRGRRCRWELDGDEVEERLRRYSEKVPFKAPTLNELRSIARDALCEQYHTGQANQVAEDWNDMIKQATRMHERDASDELARRIRELEELIRRMHETSLGGEGTQKGRQWEDRRAEGRERERQKKQERERQERERQEKERQEKERQEKERQEKERQEKERQEKERQKREKEQREREERKKAREEETRKESERRKRAYAQEQDKSWSEAWENYTKAFEEFKSKRSIDLSDFAIV